MITSRGSLRVSRPFYNPVCFGARHKIVIALWQSYRFTMQLASETLPTVLPQIQPHALLGFDAMHECTTAWQD
jgi:hypothetical protein